MPPRPERPFSRVDLARASPVETLRRSTWHSAQVFTMAVRGETWLIKDFRPSSWFFRLVVGPILTRRELRALETLRGLPGVPARAFRIDAAAMAYLYVPGESLREAKRKGLPPDAVFFSRLEQVVESMHRRGIAHLDLRNASNILIKPHHEPALVDFQSSLSARFVPHRLWRFLEEIDLSGVYKWWLRTSPTTFDQVRAARLQRIQRVHRFWLPGWLHFKAVRRGEAMIGHAG